MRPRARGLYPRRDILMRIVSGIYGGRKIEVPRGDSIRPTSDKVRGAIFNILASRGVVQGASVLDAFCGTGAMGLEALSRGADFCVFFDISKASLDIARRNIKNLGAEGSSKDFQKDAVKPGKKPGELRGADLVILDPPYKKNLLVPALEGLLQGGWLSKDALIVCETEKTYDVAFPAMFSVVDERIYKDTKVIFLGGSEHAESS